MLPIHDIKPQLLDALGERRRVVLAAPTGSGKSTQVPQMLLDSGQVEGQVLVLQPRRLAARLLARRVAAERGSRPGAEVGYKTRHENVAGPDTRILYLTQGLFLRMLLATPELPGVGAVLFDEFHERHVEGDLCLVQTAALQARHPELLLGVMSATLDTELVAGYLDCPVVTSATRAYPVTVTWLKRDSDDPPWDLAARAVGRVLAREPEGDILVFMPGVWEIRRTLQRLEELPATRNLLALPLYSDLPAAVQDRAVTPGPQRKVIVATNVAETSITIEGVRHVVDSGLARVQQYDPRRGMNVLAVRKTSRASADQRAGRAGRTAPGTCRRLWSAWDHQGRKEQEDPEVRRLDLAPALLAIMRMAGGDVAAFPWLEDPPAQTVERGLRLLRDLGALDGSGGLTPAGHDMAALPMHPRLSRLVLEGAKGGCLEQACLRAALLSERGLFVRGATRKLADRLEPPPESDFALHEAGLEQARAARFDPGRGEALGLNANAARQVDRTRALYLRQARRLSANAAGPTRSRAVDRCVLAAFPDHLAARRRPDSPVFELTGGRTARLDAECVVTADLLVAAEITEVSTGSGMSTRLGMAVPVDRGWLAELFPDRLGNRRDLSWDASQQAVVCVDQLRFDDLVVQEESVPPDSGGAARLLAERIRAGEVQLKHWNRKVTEWLDRSRCVAEWFPERRLLRYDEDDLLVILQEICDGATRSSQVRNRPCLDVVRNAMSWEDQRFVEKMAPERIQLPRGFRMRIQYTPGERPRGRARIQDFYGLHETPAVAGGRHPLLLEILAPNNRPVQTTDDLQGFWDRLYPEIKRQLSRRYPKHEWK